MLLYYIRHGDPVYEPDSLTPLGQRQAEAVGRRLALHGMDKVFTSTSARARLTARPLCELLHLEPVALDWCNENYAWNEMAVTDTDGCRRWLPTSFFRGLFRSRELAQMGYEWYNHPAFAGQNYRAGMERIERDVFAFLRELGYEYNPENDCYRCIRKNEERVALFAHEGFGLLFLSVVLRIPYPVFCTRFGISHSTITVLEFKDDGEPCMPTALQLSSDAHLYAEGLPTKYCNWFYI